MSRAYRFNRGAGGCAIGRATCAGACRRTDSSSAPKATTGEKLGHRAHWPTASRICKAYVQQHVDAIRTAEEPGRQEFYTDQEWTIDQACSRGEPGRRSRRSRNLGRHPQAVRYDLELYGFDRPKVRYTSKRTSLVVA
jgi:hypothetical protein